MKTKLYGLFFCIITLSLSVKVFSQVPDIDSLQKKIMESVRKGLDKHKYYNSYFDTSKIFRGKSPVDLNKLFKDIDKDIDMARSHGDIDKLGRGYRHLSTIDSMRGNYKGAYENFKLYSLYRDSLQKKETEKKELQARLQYEFDKKQALAKAEQEKRDAETRRVKNLQYFMIAGLTVLLLVILLIALIQWRNSRQRKNANLLLLSEKEKVESTLVELKSTQAQLIHAEKMASLGELTAGIAHEIQNPLNFVNNFSEVNKELLTELKGEADKGNVEEVKLIAEDIISNEEKINHHGKRADSIVKGMLQHSRTGTGQREMTDLNALADEYVRLTYHGLRAKDKSFNAKIETDFDRTIGPVSVVPEDIGRALLNLINNAFYAVNEKAKEGHPGYEPTVTIQTKYQDDKKEIIVKDNGNGIPQQIREKIFQPFFTTKPTGQGTGLGLSLSYDIVKAHGGDLKVNSTEGEGTEFTIQLQ
jgi:signal transduction histidine kinase